MKWIKDGNVFDGKLEYNGRVIHISGEPPADLMRRAGYTEYIDPDDIAFGKVKTDFWTYVDEAAAALTKATGKTYTRADFPTGAYSSELLQWCAEHGMPEAETGALAVKFCGIFADLTRIGRSWNELFV